MPIPADELDAAALRIALRESLRLQSHYAELLNAHDGGQRRKFRSPEEWVERLLEVGMLKAPLPNAHPG